VGNVVPPITKLSSSFDIDVDDGGINDEVKPFCLGVTSSESNTTINEKIKINIIYEFILFKFVRLRPERKKMIFINL
jgi:hypothetical protein